VPVLHNGVHDIHIVHVHWEQLMVMANKASK
jgi:hypothetical protein